MGSRKIQNTWLTRHRNSIILGFVSIWSEKLYEWVGPLVREILSISNEEQ